MRSYRRHVGVVVLALVALAGCGKSKDKTIASTSTTVAALPAEVTTTSPSTTVPGSTTVPTGSSVPGGTDYVVQKGDTLSKIAKKFGVAQAAIEKANNITNPDKLAEGQHLVIPPATATSSTVKSTATTAHTATTKAPTTTVKTTTTTAKK